MAATTTRLEEDDPLASIGLIKITTLNGNANAEVKDDGRVAIHLTEKAFKVTKHLERKARMQLRSFGDDFTPRNCRREPIQLHSVLGKYAGIPRMNIAIQIVGSRGDVQPFIPIAHILSRPPYNHRVRICTHPVFKDLVEENGLDFFSIGGDPASLMAYMVKNPGLMPGKESWKAGEVGKRRADIAEILEGCWRSCIEAGDGMGGEIATGSVSENRSRRISETSNRNSQEDVEKLFVADVIIANPPSFGHLHCAEKLGIPLHMMFTMPWSPTQYFPHPLAHMESSQENSNFANFISYTLMELLSWQGLGDVINGFRLKTLHLDPISPLWGHMLLARMKVPFTYLWSSALIEKPPDWGSHINISGFSFLSLASTYKPSDDLLAFINAGPPPVYIGFGSIVVADPGKFTDMIFGAIKRAGVRALVSKGWGGLGGDEAPDGVFLLGNVPHDWLFQHVSCVVHHGGAGTTAIGIAMGKPTVIIPFFGDQPFWGSMIYRAGAGPEPVPYKKLTEDLLVESITKALAPEIQTSVKAMSEKIAGERGAEDAVKAFHDSEDFESMRCVLCPDRVGVWRLKHTNLILSSLAAATLFDHGLIDAKHLKLAHQREWYIDEGPNDPVTGALAVVSGTITHVAVELNRYIRSLSRPSSDTTKSIIADSEYSPVLEEDSGEHAPLTTVSSLNHVPLTHPVKAAAHYSLPHLEAISYAIAAQTLPDRRAQLSASAPKKATTWAPSLRHRSTTLKPAPQSAIPNQTHSRAYEVTSGTGHLALDLLELSFQAPVAFFYNLANGFHNLPGHLLHDETVRRRDNITGFGSGVKVAGKEFTLGLYDGFTGIVTQPYRGSRKEGVLGFGKGVGKGLGGLVLKSAAAGLAVPGYVGKGIEREVMKRRDRSLWASVILVRLRQGVKEYELAGDTEREEILRRWKEIRV